MNIPALLAQPGVDSCAQQIHVRAIRSAQEFESLRSQWNGLLEKSEGSSVFLRWEWVKAWLEAYGYQDLLILAGFNANGESSILPLYVSHWPKPGKRSLRVLRCLGDQTGDAGSLGIVCITGSEQQAATAVVDWLSVNRSEWDAMDSGPLSDDPANTALIEAFAKHGWAIKQRLAPHMVVELPRTFEALSARLSQKRRAQLRAAERKLAGRVVGYQRCTSPDEIKVALNHLFRLHTARWKARGKDGAFSANSRQQFYRLLAMSMFHAGLLHLWTMKLDGTVVAVEFGFVYGGVRSSLQSGFDPEYGQYNVGSLLDAKIIEDAIAAGLRSYDFLEGENEFKRRWGAERKEYRFVRCAPASSAGALWVRSSQSKTLQRLWAILKNRLKAGS